MFPSLPNSAWAVGNLAESAEQLGNMVEPSINLGWNMEIHVNPTQVSDQMGHPVHVTLTEFPIPSFIQFFGLSFREFPRLVGRYCSQQLPKQGRGTP